MTAALEIDDLSKQFGDLHVFGGISLSIGDRGVHTIIGPNGAGKTTLFNCITGVHRPDTGTVRLNGQDVTRASVVSRVRRGLVRTFQISRVFDGMSVFDNVLMPLQKEHLRSRPGFFITGRERARLRARCSELLVEVGVDESTHELAAGSLSYGDRRTLEVAIALACNPIVLCLDEPTAGLGAGEAESMADLVGRLGQRLAILLVEHRMSMVHQVSDEVTVLAYGSIIARGSPAQVADDQRVQDVYLGRTDEPEQTDETEHPEMTQLGAAAVDLDPRERAGGGDLVLTNVNSFYGSSHVLHDVSLVAKEGQVTSVLGRNGAGKTTTLATIMGLVRARSGSIRLGGRELSKLPTYKIAQRGIALVPEQRWIFPDLTVEENIQLAGATSAELLDEAYTEFPALRERRQAKGSQLSGGQQQMLAFARVIVRKPDLVLLDEPTQGLSPIYVGMILEYIRRLRAAGVTVILVEQALDAVAAVSDTVYVMSDGRVRAQLDPSQLDENDELLARHLHIRHHEFTEPGQEQFEDRRGV
jgi:ABC-type branched-subunit amino acid transport system ATPase component